MLPLPTTTIDPDLGWEIILPVAALANTGLVKCSLTPDGIYIENTAGQYDLIGFDDLAYLLDSADALHLDDAVGIAFDRFSKMIGIIPISLAD